MKEKAKTTKFSFTDPPDIMAFDDWRIITHNTGTDDALEQIIDMVAEGLQEEIEFEQFCIFPFGGKDANSGVLCLSLTSKIVEKITA